ncbi:hypothetical protein BCR32DRAFT_294059 [Anaeromyces robustus]|uniref:Nicastrin n=1 Tax=Anaeromyces robustus TaxID=1754192 RepID=A0A1Y1X3Y7_9FUNG|nr:hypothetical protein BCR32DRAFT_294059 [Anaeromyces robustus]|eukprot:ORX80024.1 hypothetical protein BCR32DRAFT_294059 [Anaeromyces robustus]
MIIILFFILFHFLLVNCKYNYTYYQINSAKEQEIGCSVFPRILNSTSEFGSGSKTDIGTIYRITTEKELKNIKNVKIKGKLAVAISSDLVNKKNLKELDAYSDKIAGLIVLYDPDSKVPYSPDKECPNCEFGLYAGEERANYKWNPYGDGLLYEKFSYPIFGISPNNEFDRLAVIEADNYNKKHNYKKYPLYKMKFKLFMSASKNSETCLPRGHCLPIGGNSVWSTFSKKIDPNDGKKIIIVSSQLDGNSLFHDFSSGLNSQIGGLVANLGIANAFSKLETSPDGFQNHIVFTFFNGESYGYSGSQRFVQDISTPFECKDHEYNSLCGSYTSCSNPCFIFDDFKNITMNNIKGIIELNQLACEGCKNNLNYYIHVDDKDNKENIELINLILNVAGGNNPSPSTSQVNSKDRELNDINISVKDDDNHHDINIKEKREGELSNYSIKAAYEGLSENLGLPPSSAQSFLKKNRNIPAVVISDFQTEFTNEYYHNTWDMDMGEKFKNGIGYDNSICKTANIIAKSLWLYAQNKNNINEIPVSLEVDCEYINDLMTCLTYNLTACDLGYRLLNSNVYLTSDYTYGTETYTHYSGVYNTQSLHGNINVNRNYDSWITNFALFNITGFKTDQKCQHVDNCTLVEHPNYDKLNENEKNYIQNKPYSYRDVQCINGYCVKGRVHTHPAYGTGINYDIDKDLFTIVDNKKPTWTESKWEYGLDDKVTIFYVITPYIQYFELFIGVLSIILTIIGFSCDSEWFTNIMKQNVGNSVYPKLLNSTSEIGSQSNTVTATIYRIETVEDFENFKTSKLSGHYTLIIPPILVNKKNFKELESMNNVAGVIVLYDDSDGLPYSPDKECPNCEYGLYSGEEREHYKWNKYGDGLLYEYFKFPIFATSKYHDEEGVAAIIKAASYNKNKNYKNYPLYAVKLNAFMYAAKDSETCLARSDHCDPIGGNSVWSTFSKTIDPNDGKKIIIVSSQLDGNSFFHDFTAGANSQIGGTVTNLAIADALSKSEVSPAEFQNHIVFTFFSGEAYGYSGSQRFVKDISSYKCLSKNKTAEVCSEHSACQNPCMYVDDFKNITLNNIKGIVELNQLTCSGCSDINNPNYYMHVDDENDTDTLKLVNLISSVNEAYKNEKTISFNDDNESINSNNNNTDSNNKSKRQNSYSYNIKPAWEGLNSNLGLPPASAQSFLKKKKMPAVVISDFQKEFTNPFYHSSFDVGGKNATYDGTLCKTADIVAKALWLYAQNKDDISLIPSSVKADCKYVNDLMYCLTEEIGCELVNGLVNSNAVNDKFTNNFTTFSHYAGVFNDNSFKGTINANRNFNAWVANFAILRSTGRNTTFECVEVKNCTKQFVPESERNKTDNLPNSLKNYQCVSGYCIEGRVYSHPAYGIGLEYDAENESFYVVDKNLPTWTESRWNESFLTILITTSKTFQYLELFIGILFIILTVAGYYFIKNYTKKTLKIA